MEVKGQLMRCLMVHYSVLNPSAHTVHSGSHGVNCRPITATGTYAVSLSTHDYITAGDVVKWRYMCRCVVCFWSTQWSLQLRLLAFKAIVFGDCWSKLSACSILVLDPSQSVTSLFRLVLLLCGTAVTHMPQGVIIMGIYMSSNIYYLLLL